MTESLLRPKLAGETATYTFDFTSSLGASETLLTQSVTAAVYSGTDASPSSIVSGGASAAAGVVSQKLTGGLAGVLYQLLCLVTTSLGQTLELSAVLAVVPALP